jgi:hypothetical protein
LIACVAPFHANRASGVRTALGTAGDGLGGLPISGPIRRVGILPGRGEFSAPVGTGMVRLKRGYTGQSASDETLLGTSCSFARIIIARFIAAMLYSTSSKSAP